MFEAYANEWTIEQMNECMIKRMSENRVEVKSFSFGSDNLGSNLAHAIFCCIIIIGKSFNLSKPQFSY